MKYFACFLFLLSAQAWGVQRGFTCSAGAFSAEIETPTVDPDGVAGIVTSDKDPQAIELYEAPGAPVRVPSNLTIYLAVGWGDGKTRVDYLAIPKSLTTALPGRKTLVTRIETMMNSARSGSPLSVHRITYRCNVDY